MGAHAERARVRPDAARRPTGLGGEVRVINGYRERHELRWNDARLAAMDLQYHDLRPNKSLFSRLGVERLVDDDDAVVAMSEPPPDTRAFFRGKCLQKWADDIVAANWDSMVFDVGDDPLRRVPMEPARGTRPMWVYWNNPKYRPSCSGGSDRDRRIAMAERTQKQRPAPQRTEEAPIETPSKSETGEKLKAELDDLLDEIDVLETNAEDFVKSYIKGGQ
ncbi:MAG: ubiquitin-like protein Pup [Acidimicrobiales bacterium]